MPTPYTVYNLETRFRTTCDDTEKKKMPRTHHAFLSVNREITNFCEHIISRHVEMNGRIVKNSFVAWQEEWALVLSKSTATNDIATVNDYYNLFSSCHTITPFIHIHHKIHPDRIVYLKAAL